MATLNDYKLLEQKCVRIFEMLNIEELKKRSFTPKDKARFGFYYYVIQNFTSLSELDDITDCICDTDFNVRVFDDPQVDEGIDAVCIDDEQKEISIFNFKYRDTFNPDREQKKNETWQSSKFFSCILTENVDSLSPAQVNACELAQNRDKMIKYTCLAGLGALGLLAFGIAGLISRE